MLFGTIPVRSRLLDVNTETDIKRLGYRLFPINYNWLLIRIISVIELNKTFSVS